MARPPDLRIEFNRPDLSIEIIPYEIERHPVHKIRFWICGKGGRILKQDMREHIYSIALDARL